MLAKKRWRLKRPWNNFLEPKEIAKSLWLFTDSTQAELLSQRMLALPRSAHSSVLPFFEIDNFHDSQWRGRHRYRLLLGAMRQLGPPFGKLL